VSKIVVSIFWERCDK